MKSENANVLLIEDDPLYADTVAKLLNGIKAPFSLEHSDSVAGGIAVLARGGIDLVMLDLGLSDSQGLETFALVHAQDAQIPIIVLTAQVDEEIALEAVNSGAQDYLVKSEIDGQLLSRAMRYAIERQRSESALRESQRLIQEIADSTPEIISLFDLETERIVYINAQVTNILGYAPSELRSFDPRETLHLDDRAHIDRDLRRFKANPAAPSSVLTYRVRHANGEWRWLRSENLIFTRTPEGRAQQILSTTQDVTEGKLAEEALRESERRYRDLYENASDIVYTHDLEGRFTSINRAGEMATGYRREESFNQPISLFVAPEHLELVREQTLRKLAGEPQSQYEIEIIAKDGRRLRWEVNSRLIYRDGRPIGVQEIGRDITERRQTEQRSREQAALLDCAQDAILVRDLAGQILFWNRSAERIFGWTATEIMGRNLYDPDLIGLSAQNLNTEQIVMTDGEWTGELRQKTKDAREIIVESRWTLVRDEAGQAKSILIINTDITEKKRFEAQFLRMQRLDSIGALASGIAHDLNNSLAPILMALHTLQQRFTDANSQRWLSLIRRSTERSRDLIDKVLTFAKGAEGERLPLQPAQIISDLAKILTETLPKNIVLKVELVEDLWNVLGDTTQIHQVLMNLCINGRDAMPDGGTLSIKVGNLTLEEKQQWMMNEVSPGRFVQIAVADTGAGMPPELIDRIFEPFFTTKPQGQGSGLGLSTVSGIVRSHGGFITVNSIVGRGSQFMVHLPAGERPESETIPDSWFKTPESLSVIDAVVRNDRLGNRQLILVVEDDTELREVTRATLEANGYCTLGAEDGRRALALYGERQQEIALVLTDLEMPNLDGLEMSRALRTINPSVKIVGASGLTYARQIDEALHAGVLAVLNKPYTAPQLLCALDEALGCG